MTFKQLEAIFWVARLGGFAQAATKLHATQSAISKRVQELESLFDTPLFDRTLRTARLTDKGEEMLAVAQRLLGERDAAVEQFLRPEVIERRLRLGVTELTAMTWLPRLVQRIEAFYPRVVIEPDVDTSVTLRDKLLADELDIAIVPDAFDDPRCEARRVGELEMAWMCKPGMVDASRPLRMHELARYRLLTQSSKSGVGIMVDRWLGAQGTKLPVALVSNNMLALISMTVSGLGVTYLPWRCLQPMLDSGMLATIKVTPALPVTRYVALYRSDQRSTLIASVTMLAQESCDFTRMFQTDVLPPVMSGAASGASKRGRGVSRRRA
ncbi:LysR family transcriptional regulator [Ramlibacter monticola]|uniref:LysR family transcriptional regulator n=1 Tax=Ramlibacter monticola TaxID=1926872 RepID=A0A936YU17_9BURK|nr:LysR family transcriptional regulator [Ramlibacter monticola]MBL0390129.1 LysR family transcriptional regulator [Ramlibacter monticola]